MKEHKIVRAESIENNYVMEHHRTMGYKNYTILHLFHKLGAEIKKSFKDQVKEEPFHNEHNTKFSIELVVMTKETFGELIKDNKKLPQVKKFSDIHNAKIPDSFPGTGSTPFKIKLDKSDFMSVKKHSADISRSAIEPFRPKPHDHVTVIDLDGYQDDYKIPVPFHAIVVESYEFECLVQPISYFEPPRQYLLYYHQIKKYES